MKYISFPEKNFTFTKPVDMTDDECGALEVCLKNLPLGIEGKEYAHIISCWELEEDDLRRIWNGDKRIWLLITGKAMPPVLLTTKNPFE